MSASRGRRLVFFGLVAVLLLAVFHQQILYGLGAMLVSAGPPQKADMVVVLGGDWKGTRILKAAELVREGYAPRVLVSGSPNIYGHLESEVAVDFITAKGFPREDFIPTSDRNLNTVQEARNDLRLARARGVHRILLVTSEFHTGRAGRIFRREGRDMEIVVVAADTPEWHHGRWWTDREGQKIWLGEFEKTIADFFRI
ncbi:MAG TPA: YdcF family protein [Bryobacteraceae bacterium]|nr:YdcF family protein [Bryobacteraceae bacterium]